MRQLRTCRLNPERVTQAYPLVQAAMPKLSIEQWQRFAAPLTAATEQQGGGIVAVESEQGYIAGIGIYRIDHDLCHGPVLIAEHLVAIDLVNPEAVAQALALALESLAERLECDAMITHVPDSDAQPSNGWMVRLMTERGHEVETLRLCKRLSNSA